jgi:hypothetical protein
MREPVERLTTSRTTASTRTAQAKSRNRTFHVKGMILSIRKRVDHERIRNIRRPVVNRACVRGNACAAGVRHTDNRTFRKCLGLGRPHRRSNMGGNDHAGLISKSVHSAQPFTDSSQTLPQTHIHRPTSDDFSVRPSHRNAANIVQNAFLCLRALIGSVRGCFLRA